MVKIYFVCMGNYYRSRLAEELAWHYAGLHGVPLAVDSGGLNDMQYSKNVGPISRAVLSYLAEKQIQPRGAARFPKHCDAQIIYSSDIVVCTDRDEQLELFEREFPDFTGQMFGWQARDVIDDPLLQTPQLIDKHVLELIQELSKFNKR